MDRREREDRGVTRRQQRKTGIMYQKKSFRVEFVSQTNEGGCKTRWCGVCLYRVICCPFDLGERTQNEGVRNADERCFRISSDPDPLRSISLPSLPPLLPLLPLLPLPPFHRVIIRLLLRGRKPRLFTLCLHLRGYGCSDPR